MRSTNQITRSLLWGTVTLLLLGCGQAKETPPVPSPKKDATPKMDNVSPPKRGLDLSKIQLSGPAKILSKSYAQWKIATTPRYFGPENLYDLINGGSEIFLAYGFRQIATIDYKNDAHPTVTVTVEVYDMASPLGAFGRLSKYLDNMATPADAGKGLPAKMAPKGILGDGDLVFWKNKYLVHLTLMDENPEATMESITAMSNKTIPVMGKAIFDNIEENEKDEQSIQLITAFPAENRIDRSQTYQYDFPSGPDTINVFSCRYQTDKTQWSLFVTEAFDTRTKATEVLKNMKKNPEIFAPKLLQNRVIGVVKDGDSASNNELIHPQLNAFEAALSTILK